MKESKSSAVEVPDGVIIEEDVVRKVSPDQVVPLRGQPRKYFDPEALEALGESIKHNGQAQPCLVIHSEVETETQRAKFELIDGERRWRAVILKNVPELKVIVCQVRDLNEHYKMSLISNFNREGHTTTEKVLAIQDLRFNGEKVADIAIAVGKSENWVNSHITLGLLDPGILAKMDPPTPEPERIGFGMGLKIAKIVGAEQQWDVYRKIMSERGKGVSNTVISEMVRRWVNDGGYSKRKKSADGKRRMRKKTISDDLKSFTAQLPQIERLTMRLEDYPDGVVRKYYMKHGKPGMREIVDRMTELRDQLDRYTQNADSLMSEKNIP